MPQSGQHAADRQFKVRKKLACDTRGLRLLRELTRQSLFRHLVCSLPDRANLARCSTAGELVTILFLTRRVLRALRFCSPSYLGRRRRGCFCFGQFRFLHLGLCKCLCAKVCHRRVANCQYGRRRSFRLPGLRNSLKIRADVERFRGTELRLRNIKQAEQRSANHSKIRQQRHWSLHTRHLNVCRRERFRGSNPFRLKRRAVFSKDRWSAAGVA